MQTAVLIGDSIRMGYQDTVREQLKGRTEVWGPEQNGGNSRNVLAHLDEWVIARAPDIVHVNCGLHDLRKEFGTDEAAVPLTEYTENVNRILTRLRAETHAKVLWATTTPVNEEWHHARKSFDRYEKDVLAYNAAAQQAARDAGVPVNDLFSLVQQAGRDELLVPDGVHFKPEGYDLLGKTVAEFVTQHGAS
ncbi:MAG: SGNH/GDSL hydrolase family protein [Kiritimatiellae bacterium]|nr:SGNH/GDSL hydrolase family protein [Kiritimatiellia bacterium]